MRFKPTDFKNRKAYLIGYGSKPNMGLEQIQDIDSHLNAAKAGLLEWGFQENEISQYTDGMDEQPDFD